MPKLNRAKPHLIQVMMEKQRATKFEREMLDYKAKWEALKIEHAGFEVEIHDAFCPHMCEYITRSVRIHNPLHPLAI